MMLKNTSNPAMRTICEGVAVSDVIVYGGLPCDVVSRTPGPLNALSAMIPGIRPKVIRDAQNKQKGAHESNTFQKTMTFL